MVFIVVEEPEILGRLNAFYSEQQHCIWLAAPHEEDLSTE